MKVYTFNNTVKDPFCRGKQIGEYWAPQIKQTVMLYLDFFSRIGITGDQAKKIGENSLAALEYWCPDLASEIEATAMGANLPIWYLASLNARTEILSTKSISYASECSTSIYAAPDINMPQTMQTWDWHDVLAPNGLMIQLQNRKGMQFKLFTEFGMLGKIGVNSAGLGLHFNILHHTSDNDSGGVPVHAVARRILEEATTVEEAIALAFSAQVSASSVLSVFCHQAARCRAVSIELSPFRSAIVYPQQNNWLLHTNHFLASELVSGEGTTDDTTYKRYEHLKSVSSDMKNKSTMARAAAMCGPEGEQSPICFLPDSSQPDTERWQTLLTISINTKNGILKYAAGNPYQLSQTGYLSF